MATFIGRVAIPHESRPQHAPIENGSAPSAPCLCFFQAPTKPHSTHSHGPKPRVANGRMGRRTASSVVLQLVASLAAALPLAWLLAAGAAHARAATQLTCGDLISCFSAGDCGDGSFCGNFVGPKGGCASGYEMLWFNAEYMAWQRDGFFLPPLMTASLPADNGIIGAPSTVILAGNQTVSDHVRNGFGLDFGFWLNPCTGWAIAADYFNAGRDSYSVGVGPDDVRIFARPFLDAQTNVQNSVAINVPAQMVGAIGVSAFDDFQGAGAHVQKCLWSEGNGCTSLGATRLNALGGYRYYHQDSLVFIREDFGALEGNAAGLEEGFEHHAFDKFAGRNEFHGAEIGLEGRFQRCRWWCEGLACVAAGPTRHVVFVEGVTANEDPSFGLIVVRGNLLVSGAPAPNTNFGRYTRDNWQAIPRFRIGAGWQLNEWISLKLGYNLIIWNIVQAADALPPNLEVDVRNLPEIDPMNPGGPEPTFPGIRERTMVAHGLDLGLELSF